MAGVWRMKFRPASLCWFLANATVDQQYPGLTGKERSRVLRLLLGPTEIRAL